MRNTLNKGYIPPVITTAISPIIASTYREAGILANTSAYMLPTMPRSVVDQKDVPCCISCALGAAMEILHPSWPQLAPLFHYYATKFDNNGTDPDGFFTLDNAIITLTKQGICILDLHPVPYTTNGATQQPSQDAYLDGEHRRMLRQLNGLFRYKKSIGPSKVDWIRNKLSQNCPVIIGFKLPVDYTQLLGNGGFIWDSPENPVAQSSGHCVVVIGYDDTKLAIIIQDSQGIECFDKGCWWMGYRVVDSEITQEVYSLY